MLEEHPLGFRFVYRHTFLGKWSWNSAGYMYTVTLKVLSFEQACLNIRNLLHRNVLWYSQEDENNTIQYNKTQHKTWLFKSFFSTNYNLSCLHNRALQLLNFQNCLIRGETINTTPNWLEALFALFGTGEKKIIIINSYFIPKRS